MTRNILNHRKVKHLLCNICICNIYKKTMTKLFFQRRFFSHPQRKSMNGKIQYLTSTSETIYRCDYKKYVLIPMFWCVAKSFYKYIINVRYCKNLSKIKCMVGDNKGNSIPILIYRQIITENCLRYDSTNNLTN